MSYVKCCGAALVTLAGLLGGCSGGDTGGSGDRTGGASGAAASGAAAGSGGSGGSPSTGAFGNSNANPAVDNGMDILNPDAVCMVGEKCDATSADEGCGSLTLEPDVEVMRVPGNLLIVFDQSGSMEEPWGSTTKIQAASDAVVAALTPLANDLTVGAIFFPILACIPFLPPPMGGAVEPITGPSQFPFQPGSQFLAAWNAKFGAAAMAPGLGTPLQEAFDRADAALQSATLTGNTAVVAFTDGQPNCFPDPALTGTPTDTEINRAYNWFTMLNVPTYVVGLPGGNGVQVLNDIAMYGGTGQYIIPDDPTVLEAELRKIVEETVSQSFDSCEINLDPPAEAPADLHIIVTENGMELDVPRDLGNGAGWTVTDDGAHVTLMGGLCDNAKAGVYGALRFEFGCVQLPPLPPIPPPQ